jgi:hypothetical protein
MEKRRFVWQDVRTTALTGPATAVKALACPKCRARLSLRFDPASPQPDGRTAGCLMIQCLECAAGSCVDNLQQAPSFVESLGLRVETEPGLLP